jgi:hypothetical protein
MEVTKFENLAVGDTFIDVDEGVTARVLRKKSGTSGYDLQGGAGGDLVIVAKSATTKFSKKNPVIRLAA